MERKSLRKRWKSLDNEREREKTGDKDGEKVLEIRRRERNRWRESPGDKTEGEKQVERKSWRKR